MSWLFSRALVAEFSEATCSDGEPSAPLSVMPTPHKFWRNDKTMEPCQLSRFGLMCAVLTEGHGEELLMWYLADSHAKTLALPEKAQGLTEIVQAYGQSSPASLGRYDPVLHTLKTAQLSLIEDSAACSPILPRWGSMLDGALFQQPIATPPICESASGLWQTPVADDAVNRKAGKWNSRGEPKLSGQVLSPAHWPTPTVCGNYNRKGASKTSGDGLATAVNMSLTRINLDDTAAQTATARTFPTPTATAHKGWSKGHNRANTDDRIDYTIEREASQSGQTGRLNPMWVEWLMGWPLGWTELKPLGMDKFHEWRQQHSVSYQIAEKENKDENRS